ncbi:MAG: hypothetical protein WCB31_01410 [Nitrososphaeraceae archaeon]
MLPIQTEGTKPVSHINAKAAQVMKEVGIDISKQHSKDITDGMIRNSDSIVNMGCMDKSFCPTIVLPKVIEWNLQNQKEHSIEKVMENKK